MFNCSTISTCRCTWCMIAFYYDMHGIVLALFASKQVRAIACKAPQEPRVLRLPISNRTSPDWTAGKSSKITGCAKFDSKSPIPERNRWCLSRSIHTMVCRGSDQLIQVFIEAHELLLHTQTIHLCMPLRSDCTRNETTKSARISENDSGGQWYRKHFQCLSSPLILQRSKLGEQWICACVQLVWMDLCSAKLNIVTLKNALHQSWLPQIHCPHIHCQRQLFNGTETKSS